MTYTRINWQDGENGGTPLSADNLNKMDEQIEKNTNNILSIIESGSNENGDYIKFSNGTMICFKQVITQVKIDNPFGSMYETSSSVNFGDYAKEFKEVPLIFPYVINRTALLEGMNMQTTTSFGMTWLMRPVADVDINTYTINLFAIGKWK